MDSENRVAIIGGGLAGLAAAAVLTRRGVPVDLFESRRYLGGRAASVRDAQTGRRVDICQHVGMGCCTYLLDFCRTTGIEGLLRRDPGVHFFSHQGRRYDVSAAWWLPAPLHLAPSLLRLGYLSLRERCGIARTLLKLARSAAPQGDRDTSVGRWLRDQGQSAAAIERFWSVVLVGALGETIDRTSLAAAGKVFVEGFLSARGAGDVLVPTAALSELFDSRVGRWLVTRGVAIHRSTPVAAVEATGEGAKAVRLADGTRREFARAIVAVPWWQIDRLLNPRLVESVPRLAAACRMEAAPITGVHLWFDRPVTSLPHAALVGRLAQWVFRRTQSGECIATQDAGHYCQVVISASHDLVGRDHEAIVDEVCRDLTAVFPEARDARLLHWRVMTERRAVFSSRPGVDADRPSQETPIPGLLLAGDWTDTLWPSTMESAVRSGYAAAERVLRSLGREEPVAVDELPVPLLSRILFGKRRCYPGVFTRVRSNPIYRVQIAKTA